MQQILFDFGVRVHRQGQLALGLSEPPGAMQQALTQGAQALEGPRRRTFGARIVRSRLRQHLHFAAQVVGHHRTQSDHLVCVQPPSGDQVQPGLLLGLGEDRFLSAAAVVEEEHAVGRVRLVGDHHAVFVIEGPRFEQIQLQRFLGLAPYRAAHEKKPVGGRPAGRGNLS